MHLADAPRRGLGASSLSRIPQLNAWRKMCTGDLKSPQHMSSGFDVLRMTTGAILLIPQGARLIGKYDARLAFAQRRILLTWTRLILPNGKSLDLDALPAGDAAGQAGLEDKVDHRWGTLLGTAALSTLLSIGAEIGADDDDDLVRAIRRGAIDTFNQAGQLAVEKGLSTPPIITIRPGAQVRALVTEDLLLEPYEEEAR